MKENIHYLRYPITYEDNDKQVLAILRGNLELSTKKIRSVKWEEKGILLDGQRVTVRQKVRTGQVLEILLNDTDAKEDRILPAKMSLSILYEDEDLIFLQKPSGIVSHPSMGHSDDSLANGVKAYFLDKDERSNVHLIGRLDKDTSGVLGIAKNGVTKERMLSIRKQGGILKEYLALVQGCPQEEGGWIRIPMEEYRDPQDGFKLKMRYPKESCGLEAATHYQLVDKYEDYSLISLYLETGRMHQIRYHMSQMGHPLLGDGMYGTGETNAHGMTRAALHAYRVRVKHPFSGKELEILAEVPQDMRRLLDHSK